MLLVKTNTRYPQPSKQAPVIKITGKKGSIDYTPETTVDVDYSVFKKSEIDKMKLNDLKKSCISSRKLQTLTKIIF